MTEKQKNTVFEGEPLITGHDYDGIEEFDNPLPGWWLATFYLTIIFAIGYYGYYQLGNGPKLRDELKADKAKIAALQQTATAGVDDLFTDDALLAILKQPDKVKAGSQVFATRCVSCHGPQGQGLIGPNLTDKFWIHGGKLSQIAKTVREGVLDKGMPSWGPLMSTEETQNVVAFVKSLKGTNPPNPKAPQGVEEKE